MNMTRLAVPRSIKAEHRELHHELTRALEMGGRIGEAAGRVAELMRPHMRKEEEFCLPPLAALASLARGETVDEATDLMAMSERLKGEFASLVEEHDEIVRALQNLIVTAKGAGRAEIVDFAEKLVLHAEMEEEVLYPAAILAGEFLRTRRARQT